MFELVATIFVLVAGADPKEVGLLTDNIKYATMEECNVAKVSEKTAKDMETISGRMSERLHVKVTMKLECNKQEADGSI